MESWGVQVKAGEPLWVVPKKDTIIHISQAALGEAENGKGPKRCYLHLKIDGETYVLGTLTAEGYPQIKFNLVLEKGFELSHDWKDGIIHMYGYMSSNNEETDKDDSDKSGNRESDDDDDEGELSSEDGDDYDEGELSSEDGDDAKVSEDKMVAGDDEISELVPQQKKPSASTLPAAKKAKIVTNNKSSAQKSSKPKKPSNAARN